jgi:hypothetical protein
MIGKSFWWQAALAVGAGIVGLLSKVNQGMPSEKWAAASIIAPSGGNPFELKADQTLSVDVRLRLPLTPPPGVQQPAAVEGWRVLLQRGDLVGLDGKTELARYEFPVMRLRPAGTEGVYRITVEVAPWLLPGRYDVSVEGPGVASFAPQVVIVPGGGQALETIDVDTISCNKTTFKVRNWSPKGAEQTLNLAVPESLAGIALFVDEKPVLPETAAFSSLSGGVLGKGRILSFRLDIPAAQGEQPGIATVRWQKKGSSACEGDIVWPGADEVEETMAWRNLAWRSKHRPLAVVWYFGDRRWGAGPEVRHRWLVQNEARVVAAAIDEFGRTCNAHSSLSLNPLKRAGGCGCTAIGRGS